MLNKNLANPLNSACCRIALGFIFSLLSSLPFGSGLGGNAFAQQLPLSSQYYTNPFIMNPAYAGISENLNVFLTHRSQWTGLAGAPETSYLTIEGPIPAKNSSLGLKIYSDVTDITSRTGAFANYSYNFKISDSNNLYFGLACGVLNNKIDFSKIQIPDNNDPFLSLQTQNKAVFSADLGIVYIRKRLTVDFAIPQLLGNSIKYPIINGGDSYYNLNRQYQGSVKYLFTLSKEKEITAYPLVMFRAAKGTPFQYDVNGVIDWKKIGWLGVTYHSNYALAVSGGIRYRSFCIGYAYDIGLSNIKTYTGSSSEFLIGYTLLKHKKIEDRFVKNEESKTDAKLLAANAKNDSINKAEIKKLKTELAKAKETGVAPINEDKDAFDIALAAKFKADQAKMDSLKAELEKAKEARLAATINKGSEEAKPTAFITIRLLDEKGNQIKDAKIEVVDKATNEVIATPLSNNDGYTRIPVPSGKTVDIVVSKVGYFYKTLNEIIPDAPGYDKKLDDIKLQKLETGKKVIIDNIAFDINQTKFKKESLPALDNAVKLMKETPSLEMEISGYTDNQGPAKFNQRLSEQRAKAVMDYLIKNGCDKSRLTYKGYGSSKPVISNSTFEGRKQNRRTEFRVLKVDSEPKEKVEKTPAKVGDSHKTAVPEKNVKPIKIKKKKKYRSKHHMHKNRILIGG